MRFTDFLRTAVLLFGGAATALAAVAIAGAGADDDRALIYFALGWWLVAAAIGGWLGRPEAVAAGLARLMASARSSPMLPELEPGAVLFNRLWALAVFTVVTGGLAFLLPQVPAVAAGYVLIIALAWRKQAPAVAAVEERDGVRFYVEPTSPFKPTSLIRTPWLRRIEPVEERVPEQAAG